MYSVISSIHIHSDKMNLQLWSIIIKTVSNIKTLLNRYCAAHNPAVRWCVGSFICDLARQQIRWRYVGPTSVLSSRLWANFCPTYIFVWLVRLWRGSPIRVTHTTEQAHHRAAGLCAARWCVARLCAIRLGCVEGPPWNRWNLYAVT